MYHICGLEKVIVLETSILSIRIYRLNAIPNNINNILPNTRGVKYKVYLTCSPGLKNKSNFKAAMGKPKYKKKLFIRN